MSTIKAIILDFDGVIVESNEEKTAAFKDLFRLYPSYQDEMMEYHLANFSVPRVKKFEHYVFTLMRRPGDAVSVDMMAQTFSGLVMQRVVACPDVPGARGLLKEFSHRVPLYISSATPLDELEKIIHARRLTAYFKKIFGNPPYEKEAAIQWVLEQERALPSEVVFIGDAVSDYTAAKNIGVEFIGRNSGLSIAGIEAERHDDLHGIADTIRARIKS